MVNPYLFPEAKRPPREGLFPLMQQHYDRLLDNLLANGSIRRNYIMKQASRGSIAPSPNQLESEISNRVTRLRLAAKSLQLDVPIFDSTEATPLILDGASPRGPFSALRLLLKNSVIIPSKLAPTENNDFQLAVDLFKSGVVIFASPEMPPFIAATWDVEMAAEDYYFRGRFFKGQHYYTTAKEVAEKVKREGYPDEGKVYLEALRNQGLQPDYLDPTTEQAIINLLPKLELSQ